MQVRLFFFIFESLIKKMEYYKNKPEGYYDNVRHEMLKYLPQTAKKIIDIGCGNGAFAAIVKEKNQAEVWGIELMEEEAKIAESVLDKVYIGPCEDFIQTLPNNYFDVIYFNDVLEHLVDPYSVLDNLKCKLTKNGVIISSIPNVRHYRTFAKVVFGKDWKYDEYGIMDKTHLRFFTGKSIKRMYLDLGFKIIIHEPINITKSIKPNLFNILVLFTHMDIRYLQYATVVKVK